MHALVLLLALAAGGADVYRWIDADGQVHLSDRPVPGAQRIEVAVPRPATSPPDMGQSQGTFGAAADEPAAPVRYQGLTIASPRQDEVLWNIEGQLNVEAAVQPVLLPGHALRFYLDGRMTEAPPGITAIQVPEVYRGEHTLRVEVLNEAGQRLAESPTVRFFVRQTSLENPANNPAANPVPLPALPRP